MRWLLRLLNYRATRLISLSADEEERIITELARVEGILDYFELQRQGGYVLYGRTDDKRYLGISMFAETILRRIEQLNDQSSKEVLIEDSGYESTV